MGAGVTTPVGTPVRTRLSLGILGPLSARLCEEDLALGGRRQRAVVAVLLLARGHQVGTARLLDALWDGAPPPSGAASLQSYVSHLRRALEPDRPARAPSRVLVSRADGYALPRDQVDVDAWRFEELVEEAAGCPGAAERSTLLREALALWRGPVLPAYAGADWVDTEARRLEEIRDLARERLLEARLEAGESAIVVPELEALLAESPLREERWRLLALAQYRSQRQADALATLRRARRTLADELGVDPGQALRDLERRVLAQADDLAGPPPQTAQPKAVPVATSGLVDRETESRRLLACLRATLAGEPGLAVIAGPAGIGKTSLLDEVRTRARAAGATVLSARGSQLEQGFGFGAVRQLFDPVLADASTQGGLLTGAAVGASRVFDATYAATDTQSESLFSVLHGLYWLTSNLAARGPVVIAVDDVQWCDTGSLRFLGYLTRRLEGVPVLLVSTHRTGELHPDDDLVHEITAHPEVVAVHPGPLTSTGTAEMVRGRLTGADEAFVGACFRTTSGNPLLLRQLLRALEEEGVKPDASHADTVRAIGSRAVSSMVMMRLRRMPDASRDVARAVAVLGTGATLATVAALTGHRDDVTASAVATLARTEVLRPDLPLGFVHPLVEAAVHDDLPLGERELAHARAAQVLTAAGGSAEQVASHLVQAPPRGDPAVVTVLRGAAAREVERGAVESATAYLRRALAEPPAERDRPPLMMELGALEALTSGMDALAHLRAAYERLEDPVAKAECAVMLSRTAVFAGPGGEATRIARAAAAALPRELSDHRQSLVALARVAGFMHGLPVEEYLTDPLPPVEGDGPGARGLAALTAWELLCRGEERERAVELARFAVADRVLQRSDPGLLWVVAANALFLAGEDTVPFWEAELEEALRTGSMFASLATHLWLGFVLWQCGDLPAAMQSMLTGTEQNFAWSLHGIGQMYVQPYSVQILLDLGRVGEAREMLEASRATVRVGDTVRLFEEAEARLLLAEDRPPEALALLDRAETRMQVVHNPVWRPWRSQRATVLHALGRQEEALRLVREELARAERWGTPGLVGRTWLTCGLLEGEAGEASLRTAITHLARSPHRLDLARAQAALGGLLADGDEARSLLAAALEAAGECGADALWSQVACRLRAVGVAVADHPASRVRLTGAERRIAAMAARGVPEPEIAQTLFLTTSTVHSIVTSVMARLGVSTPAALEAAASSL